MSQIIVGLGEILWDVFPDKKVLGGAPANFAYIVSQLGLDGQVISAIGSDNLGTGIIECLRAKELRYHLSTVNKPTGTVKVTVNDAGIPSYDITRDVAWDNIPFTEEIEQVASKTKAVCFGSLAQRNDVSRSTINKFLEAMPKDSLKIFDLNLRQDFYTKDVITSSLKSANILKFNDEEFSLLSELFGFQDNERVSCINMLQLFDLDIVIYTKGSEGSMITTREDTYFKRNPITHVADTVGAGDAFTGAFIAAYLSGETIENAHNLAIEVSAYVCMQHGAMPRMADAFVGLFK